jgi:hypothetical protein
MQAELTTLGTSADPRQALPMARKTGPLPPLDLAAGRGDEHAAWQNSARLLLLGASEKAVMRRVLARRLG